MNLKAKQVNALRQLPRTSPKHIQLHAGLRQVLRNYLHEQPQFTPRDLEHLRYLLVDEMNHMELNRQIQWGRVTGMERQGDRLQVSMEMQPYLTAERLVINMTVTA
jgi:hypothetical protein